MAKRQPFELKGVLIVYNCGMVLLSVYMLKEVIINIDDTGQLSTPRTTCLSFSAAISFIIGT